MISCRLLPSRPPSGEDIEVVQMTLAPSRSRPMYVFALQVTGSRLRIITEEKPCIYKAGVAQAYRVHKHQWAQDSKITHSPRATFNHISTFMLHAPYRSTNSSPSDYSLIIFFPHSNMLYSFVAQKQQAILQRLGMRHPEHTRFVLVNSVMPHNGEIAWCTISGHYLTLK